MRFKFTPFVCIVFRRITSCCKKRGFKFSFTFAKLRASWVALVALSAKDCASVVAPCIPSASVSAIKWRRKFNHSSRPKPPRGACAYDNCAKRAITKVDGVGARAAIPYDTTRLSLGCITRLRRVKFYRVWRRWLRRRFGTAYRACECVKVLL